MMHQEVLRQYQKQIGASLENMNHCAEIKLLAERKAGTILAKQLRKGRPEKWSQLATISEVGITKSESSRWQQEAKVPAKEFERYVSEKKDSRRRCTRY